MARQRVDAGLHSDVPHLHTQTTKFQQLFLGRKNRRQKSLLVCLLNKSVHILVKKKKKGGGGVGGIFNSKQNQQRIIKQNCQVLRFYFDFFHLLDEFFF